MGLSTVVLNGKLLLRRGKRVSVIPFVVSALILLPAHSMSQCPQYTTVRAHSVEVTPDDNLNEALRSVGKNTTVYLADGTYKISSNVQITADSITLRSKSGNRDKVVLDGNQGTAALDRSNFTPEVLAISGSDVHVADLSVRYARDHGIHIYPPADRAVTGTVLHNLHVYDCGEQLIKVNSNGSSTALYWVDKGILEGSLVEFVDNSVMEDMGDYYYTGGLDVHGGEDWIVRWNIFRNIQRDGKLMEHAVHFWSKSRGSLVENNRFENCYRAIGFGMKQSADGLVRTYPDGAGDNPYLDHVGGCIRGNVIYNKAGVHLESGIELTNVATTDVVHNTVYCVDEPFNSIEYRWPDTRVTIVNNLTSHRIMERDGAQGVAGNNLTSADAALFVAAAAGDLHLVASAATVIDKGRVLEQGLAGYDMDGTPYGSSPDIGADEYAAPGAVVRTTIARQFTPLTPGQRSFLVNGRMLAGGMSVAPDGAGCGVVAVEGGAKTRCRVRLSR